MKNPEKPNIKLLPTMEVVVNDQLKNEVSKMIAKYKGHFALLGGLDMLDTMKRYIIYDVDQARPVGLIGWVGPPDEADPSWWVRPESRQKGYGKRAVELLAEEMCRLGVQKIKKDILIDTKTEGEDIASSKLVRYLKKRFNSLRKRSRG